MPEIHSEVKVCDECMFVHANGEGDPERPADMPQAWSLWAQEMGLIVDIAMGGEHSEHCPNRDRVVGNGVECDCDTDEFSTSACEGCGDTYHGRRHTFTVFYLHPIGGDPRHWEIYGRNDFVFGMFCVVGIPNDDPDTWHVRAGGHILGEFPSVADAVHDVNGRVRKL